MSLGAAVSFANRAAKFFIHSCKGPRASETAEPGSSRRLLCPLGGSASLRSPVWNCGAGCSAERAASQGLGLLGSRDAVGSSRVAATWRLSRPGSSWPCWTSCRSCASVTEAWVDSAGEEAGPDSLRQVRGSMAGAEAWALPGWMDATPAGRSEGGRRPYQVAQRTGGQLRAETLYPHIEPLARPRGPEIKCFRSREGLHRTELRAHTPIQAKKDPSLHRCLGHGNSPAFTHVLRLLRRHVARGGVRG